MTRARSTSARLAGSNGGPTLTYSPWSALAGASSSCQWACAVRPRGDVSILAGTNRPD
jgi:hypothetical protein